MSDLFDNIKPGHTVHYLTPQGQTRKGRVVMNKGTHLVLNAGGKYGTPQVVTPRNFVKAQDGTRVTSALLSNVAKSVKRTDESVVGAVVGAGLVAAGAAGLYKNAKPKIKAYFKKKEAMKTGEKYAKQYAKDAAMYAANAKDPKRSKRSQSYHAKRAAEFINRSSAEADKVAKLRKEETVNEVSKELAKRYVIAAVKDINYSSREAEGARTAAYADYMNKKAVKRSNAIAKSTKAMRAYKDHVWGKDIYKEDSKDAEGAAERVAKTKKHKKKLDELDSSTLASYVSKAIANRKKSQSGADMARRIHTPERAAYFVDKMGKRAAKRSAGIKTAVAKIASNLPAEPLKAHSDSEGAKHGGWSGMHEAKKIKAPKAVNWQITQTKTFSVYKSTEGGMPLKHHMARLAAVGIPSRKAHSPYVGHTALEIPAKHEKKASKILYGESFDPSMISEVSAPGKEAWIKANKQRFIDRYGKEKGLRVLYAKAWKDVKEARESEWAANQALAGNVSKSAKGHYLVRDGRKLSGPHSPEDAVKAYKGMSDSKGVKIVHVKETHEFDVTRELISEAKVKEAAQKAVNLKKKAKGNKHVETEPKLDLPDRVNTTTLSADEGQDNAKV